MPNLHKPVTDLTLTFNNETIHRSDAAEYLVISLDKKENCLYHRLLQKIVIIFHTMLCLRYNILWYTLIYLVLYHSGAQPNPLI